MTARKVCPICHTESVGGKPHRYHARNRARIAEAVVERRVEHFAAIVCDAVDEARVYYQRHLERRRMQARESKRRQRLRRRLDPLIRELAEAVDLGRTTAGW